MQLSTILFNQDNRFFKFKMVGDQYICDICYWKGELVELEDGNWSAEIKQKYDPFEHYRSDKKLASREAGMRWITSRLIKEKD